MCPEGVNSLFTIHNSQFLRHGDGVEDGLDDVFGGDVFGFGFVSDGDAVAEDVHGHGFDILGGDVSSASEKGCGFGGEGEIDRCSGGGSVFNVMFEIEPKTLGITGAVDEGDDVVFNPIIDTDGVDHFAGVEDVFRANNGLDFDFRCKAGGQFEDFSFLFKAWVSDDDFEHESIHLGFGERVGSFLLDRVLGGHDEKEIGKLESFFADGDLTFLHRFQEGGLHFRGSAVDFIGQHDVAEYGALFDNERSLIGAENFGAYDIGR